MMIRAVQLLGYDIEVLGFVLGLTIAVIGGIVGLVKLLRKSNTSEESASVTGQISGHYSNSVVHNYMSASPEDSQHGSNFSAVDYALIRRAQIAESERDMDAAKECYDEIIKRHRRQSE